MRPHRGGAPSTAGQGEFRRLINRNRRRCNRQGRRVRSGHVAPACNSNALTCDRPVQTELPGPYSPNHIILSSSSKLIPRTTFPEPHSPNHVSQSYFPSHIPEPRLSAIFPEHISRTTFPEPRKNDIPSKRRALKPPRETPYLTFHQRPQIPSRLRILNAPSSIPRTDVGSRCERTSNSAANGHRKPSNDPPPLFHTPSTFRQALPPIVPGNRTSNHSTLLRRWMRPLRRCPAATSSQRYGGRLLPHSIFRIFDRR